MGGPVWELSELEEPDWAEPKPVVDGPVTGIGEPHRDTVLEEEARKLSFWAHMAGTIGEIAEIIHDKGAVLVGHEGGVLAGVAELAPLAGLTTVVVAFHELYRAFTTDERLQAEEGICYGLMWGVLGLADIETPSTKPSLLDDQVEVPMSDRERTAWEEGVAKGRAIASYGPIREEVLRAIAYEMAVQGRDLATDPQHHAWNEATHRVLTRIWDNVREEQFESVELNWENPSDGFPTKPSP
jgi:hypothetical protein